MQPLYEPKPLVKQQPIPTKRKRIRPAPIIDIIVLFHCKAFILSFDHKIDDRSILYFGSHNLSKAAWGKMEKSGMVRDNNVCSKRFHQMSIANYELGVLFNAGDGTKKMKKEILNTVQFEFPPQKYYDNDKPWYYTNYCYNFQNMANEAATVPKPHLLEKSQFYIFKNVPNNQ
eukprot:TRINITY_DN1026_c0_g1_i1.p3 TRINITY_DN1026_c0_g1~~TRINITY_DN1026_c0_g1_i1.p3  ORF type:complete len:173 (-),score=25.21 TRINITY_DN1026_c0_g1_i1:39-557(-)